MEFVLPHVCCGGATTCWRLDMLHLPHYVLRVGDAYVGDFTAFLPSCWRLICFCLLALQDLCQILLTLHDKVWLLSRVDGREKPLRDPKVAEAVSLHVFLPLSPLCVSLCVCVPLCLSLCVSLSLPLYLCLCPSSCLVPYFSIHLYLPLLLNSTNSPFV